MSWYHVPCLNTNCQVAGWLTYIIKAGGIIAMGGAILVLLVIPYINTSDIRNTTYRIIFKFCFWLFIADFVILGRVLARDPRSLRKSNASEQFSSRGFKAKKLLMFMRWHGFFVYTFSLINKGGPFIQKIGLTLFHRVP